MDRILGDYRLGGFRADGIWLFFSTVLILFAALFFIPNVGKSRSARINLFICLIGILAFALFVYRIITAGLLDFG